MFWFTSKITNENQDENQVPTLPPPGIAQLIVEDKSLMLFLTVEWTITARVGSFVIARSTVASQSHSTPEMRRWARQLIRSRYVAIRRMGVDVDAAYVGYGGELDDLDNVRI
jgi:hypothetical protein